VWLSRLALGVCLVGAVFGIVSVAKAPRRDLRRSTGDWETVFSEDFDSGIGGGWTVRDESDGDGGEYTWGIADAFVSSGDDQSAWSVGGGADGVGLDAGINLYPDNVDSWLVYGPVELSGVSDSRLGFDWWIETGGSSGDRRPWASLQQVEGATVTPEEGDWFGWCILTDDNDLDRARCTYVSGSTGSWASAAVPLDGFLSSEADAVGEIWIAFHFVSDGDGVSGRGSFVDDVMVETRRDQYGVFLPLVRLDPTPTSTPKPTPTATLSPTPEGTPMPVDLTNGGFEADWGEEESHRVLVIPLDGSPYVKDVDNIFTPPHWLAWFYHDSGTWDQPEVRDAWSSVDPRRVHEGEKGTVLFTFYRRHDAGFLQQVDVDPGAQLKLSAWAHAWSNWQDGPHPDDPLWSEGPGYDCGFALQGEAPNDDWLNFTFRVGIDPTGGRDPYADTVVWGWGAHIYNCYYQVPSVETEARSRTVTIFLRSRTLWPFKHNDAYWDDVTLEVVR
jgi:hypothetical protein